MEKKRVLVLGCGQFYRGDDAIGLIMAQHLKEEYLPEGWEVRLSQSPLDDLLALADSYDRIFLIDAMVSGLYPAGTVRRLERDQWPGISFRVASGHSLSLPEAVALLEKVYPDLQLDVVAVGIEVTQTNLSRASLSEEIDSQVAQILENLKKEIIRHLQR